MQEFNPENLLLKTGFAELYEYENPKENLLGKFVTFSKENPGKITVAKNDDYIIGVVTIKHAVLSNESQEWQGKYLKNEYGDTYIAQKEIARGVKQYDSIRETDIICTFKDVDYSGVINPEFNSELTYDRRQAREEWATVALLGQVIVRDNGTCSPGDFCTLYQGDNKDLFGTAVVAKNNISTPKFYVLNRVSSTTITILMK